MMERRTWKGWKWLRHFLGIEGSAERRILEFHKPGQIPVNTPTCSQCGKIFLDCQCVSANPDYDRAI
jgi:hypothetical protein